MTKPLVTPALAQFVTATAGRNMTRPSLAAVAGGVATMVLLTVNPAYEASHHWIDAVLWACLAFFTFEWIVRIRASFRNARPYLLTGRGVLDTGGVLAVPIALAAGAEPNTAWLFAILWFLKVIPGIPGLR